MKNFLFITILLPLFGQIKAENLLDIYRTIPAKLLKDQGKNDFFLKKGKWYTISLVDDPLEVEADLKNGYVYFADDGTGGGWSYTEIALFRNSEGDPIIAQTDSSQEGLIYYHDEKIVFVKRHKGKWTVINPLPKIDRRAFFPGISDELYKQYRSVFRILYKLPRIGTDLEVSLHIDSVDKLPGQKESETEENDNRLIRAARKIDKLVYTWHRQTGTFVLSKKCRTNECNNSHE